MDTAHDERPLGVLLEEGALVEPLAGALALQRRLVDVRRRRIERVGERRVALADGAVGDAFDGLAETPLGLSDPRAASTDKMASLVSVLGALTSPQERYHLLC